MPNRKGNPPGKTKSKKQTKASKKKNRQERIALDPVVLINELMMIRWKAEGKILTQEMMPVEQARIMIRGMYARVNQTAPYICKMMLDDLIKAEIVPNGTQWVESAAISKMSWHLQVDERHIEREIVEWLKYSQAAVTKEYGPDWAPNAIVYKHYKYLRIERGWLFEPPKKEREAYCEEAWRRASEEPLVKEALKGKEPEDIEDFKREKLEMARYKFRSDPEIKKLMRTFRR